MKPRLYSKTAIGLSTLFLSPFFGCILFAYNLSEVGKQRLNPFFILGGILWTLVFRKLVGEIIQDDLSQFLISNAVGASILSFFFWDNYFGIYASFETKKVWKPLVIFTGICVVLLVLQLYLSGKNG